METRAAYLMVGTFVLATFFGILGFFLWLASDDIEYKANYYDVYFQGSVTGLTVGAKVNYMGVPVGQVKKIGIDPQQSKRVLVNVAINQDIAVHEDAVAWLEMQGITGYTFIQIDGGTADTPLLEAKPGQQYPVMASRYSSVEELLTSLPKIANQLTNLMDRVNLVLDEKNRKALSETLASVQSFSKKLDKMADPLDEMIKNTSKAMKTLDAQASGVGKDVQGFFKRTEPYQVNRTVSEAHKAASGLNKVINKLDESPRRFLFESPQSGYAIPQN